MDSNEDSNAVREAFDIFHDSLLWVAGGALASQVPFWLQYAYGNFGARFHSIVVTPAAQRFVTMDALRPFASEGFFIDDWNSPMSPDHVRVIDEITDVVVYPATFKLIADLSSFASSTPLQLAVNGRDDRHIHLFSSLPPDAESTVAYEHFRRTFRDRSNVHLYDPMTGGSFVGDREGRPAVFFPRAIKTVAERRNP
ncbi:hypothetical protein [Corynebacterium liangguodongii]|uniref:hypothetical protein n=1 Tax=Corynebacterium liangguodongii TaxID=2079535 RepID=UPI0011B24CFA|nr:hypothetical protein [Corynebacterium liangguodongii]